MKKLRNQAKELLPYSLRRELLRVLSVLFNAHSNQSFSQEGEDMILRRIFERQEKGFYVDVGAHHPKLFSNTYFFYKKGWRGINIDANPGSMSLFKIFRPKDINLEIAVSDTCHEAEFYIFNEPALNTLDKELALRQQSDHYKIKKKVLVEAKPLSSILEEYLPQNQIIDFLSVDIEDWDIKALKSNDWNKFRPRYLLIEDRYFDFENFQESEVYSFMRSLNYKLYSKSVNTLIFQNNYFNGNK